MDGRRAYPTAAVRIGDLAYEATTLIDLRDPSPIPSGAASVHGLSRTKRAFDVVFAGVGLVLSAPIWLLIATVLWVESGSVMFVQPRAGLGMGRFGCLKFRSMVPDAQQKLSALLAADPTAAADFSIRGKLRNDPRITWFGRLLRKSSLDELPQLINVLRGDMSIVGPRPITLREIDLYGPRLAEAMQVRPGLTGLWQVSGRSDVGYGQRAHLDVSYVRSCTLGHDLRIILRTVRTVLIPRGNGAY